MCSFFKQVCSRKNFGGEVFAEVLISNFAMVLIAKSAGGVRDGGQTVRPRHPLSTGGWGCSFDIGTGCDRTLWRGLNRSQTLGLIASVCNASVLG